MILLTDEEINLCGIKNIMTKEDAQSVAKAQLKKVMEWLDSLSFVEFDYDETFDYKLWVNGEAMGAKETINYLRQSLLDEVK